ncbi:hypothetical protein O3P69_002967 [Scylla paramamosain]|uniref:Secreted protein n=1 Tax=Scylla paramamosain TaxID=85552 RepID=A0AAW0UJT4_SCYPA
MQVTLTWWAVPVFVKSSGLTMPCPTHTNMSQPRTRPACTSHSMNTNSSTLTAAHPPQLHDNRTKPRGKDTTGSVTTTPGLLQDTSARERWCLAWRPVVN